jgi:hypothetical protein
LNHRFAARYRWITPWCNPWFWLHDICGICPAQAGTDLGDSSDNTWSGGTNLPQGSSFTRLLLRQLRPPCLFFPRLLCLLLLYSQKISTKVNTGNPWTKLSDASPVLPQENHHPWVFVTHRQDHGLDMTGTSFTGWPPGTETSSQGVIHGFGCTTYVVYALPKQEQI